MKLTGELKDKVTKAEYMEEKKDIIAQAGMELSDDELENVAGGEIRRLKVRCGSCGGTGTVTDADGSVVKCGHCDGSGVLHV